MVIFNTIGYHVSVMELEKNKTTLDLNTYQQKAKDTDSKVTINSDYVYYALGLADETGEVLGKVKKIFRDNEGQLSSDRLEAIKGELGDVLWYLASLSTALGLSLEEVAEENIKKLASRKERGLISGDGDNR